MTVRPGTAATSPRLDTKKVVEERHYEVVVEVSNMDIGFNSDDLPHIFDRFYRSTQAQTMTNSGSGLGLAIVQKVIEMHQGEIAVESLPQTGSTLRVLLPAM